MTVYEDIRQCLTLVPAKAKRGRRPCEQDLGIIEDAAVVADEHTIAWVGPRKDLPKEHSGEERISSGGSVWLPGLVECHTHLVFGGSRVADFAARCAGATYQQIAQRGGGILSTVEATRSTPAEELLERGLVELLPFMHLGVRCLEIKSGYGLTLESEIKMLECVQALGERTGLDLVPTFLPAHAVPPEFKGRADAYVDAICSEWLPEIRRRKLAVFFDVFLEHGYFNAEETRRMAQAAADHGLKLKLHVDQFTDQGGAALAAELGATSCDHLDSVSAAGIAALAASNTVAVLAPGASLFTGTPYPPARALIDAGATVALTTDFNPGTCPSHNLPLMMTLACTQMKMTIPEAIVGATLNAAIALGVEDRFGTIEAGRPLKTWQVPYESYQAVAYRFGEI